MSVSLRPVPPCLNVTLELYCNVCLASSSGREHRVITYSVQCDDTTTLMNETRRKPLGAVLLCLCHRDLCHTACVIGKGVVLQCLCQSVLYCNLCTRHGHHTLLTPSAPPLLQCQWHQAIRWHWTPNNIWSGPGQKSNEQGRGWTQPPNPPPATI